MTTSRFPALVYRFGDRRIVAAIHSRSLWRMARALFAEYAVAESADEAPAVTVRREGGHYVIRRAGDPAEVVQVPSLAAALGPLEWALTCELLAASGHLVQIHAAGCTLGGRAIVMLGPSGVGKSTLAYLWSRAGIPLLGDDVVCVDRSALLQPFKRLFKLDPAAVIRAGATLEDTPLWAAESDEAWYDPVAGAGWAQPAPLAAVLLARRRVDAPATFRPLTKVDALAALMASVIPTGLTGGAAFEVLASAIQSARAFAVEGEAPSSVAALGALVA